MPSFKEIFRKLKYSSFRGAVFVRRCARIVSGIDEEVFLELVMKSYYMVQGLPNKSNLNFLICAVNIYSNLKVKLQTRFS